MNQNQWRAKTNILILNILLLIAVVVFTHFLTLLDDGLAFDAWLIQIHRLEMRFDLFLRYYIEHRQPHLLILPWLTGNAPNMALTYSTLSVLTLLICNITIFIISRLVNVSVRDSTLISLISFLYPGYQTLSASATYNYQVHLPFFFIGVILVLLAQKLSLKRRVLLRVLAFFSFFVSFNTGSLLIFYVAFIVLLMAINSNRFTAKFILQHLDLALCPLVFWFITRWVLFPTPPIFNADYNTPRLDFALNGGAWLRFGLNSIWGILRWSIAQTPAWLPLAFVVIFAISKFNPLLSSTNINTRATLQMIFFGIFCWVCSVFAYVAVGKIAVLHGHDSRFNLLVGYPVAIICVGLLKLFLDSDSQLKRLSGWTITFTLCAAFMLANIDNQLAWFARWIKIRSVMENLPSLPNIYQVSIITVNDDFTPLQNESVGWALMENYFDWTGAAQLALGTAIVADDQLAYEKLAKNLSNLTDQKFIREFYLLD